MGNPMRAPFPYFGGKREIASAIWERLGAPKQYIEPFCGSAAILLAAPTPASLEVIGDMNGFVANFWRAVVNQPGEVAKAADYPVSHIDLGARHAWLLAQRDRLGAALQDPLWHGDARVAGWWLYGQCAWIGSGWCEWRAVGQIPHVSDAGRGIHAVGQSLFEAGECAGMVTSAGSVAWRWLHQLSRRLERVRVIHGSWARCLNHHYGGDDTAVVFDPPYLGYEGLYRSEAVAKEVETWCRDNAGIRIALCGHRGDYDLPDWSVLQWARRRLTYGGDSTTSEEAIWFSPACLSGHLAQSDLFAWTER